MRTSKMKEGETIHDMFTKFSSITNELRSLGEPISMNKQVRKVLQILPKSWESKVDAITEAKDLKVLTMDALIGNLKTHEMNRNYDLSKKEAMKDKSLMLKRQNFVFFFFSSLFKDTFLFSCMKNMSSPPSSSK